MTTHQYQSGFGNEFATEAVTGALPVGQNSPQRAPLGLYAEQFSGTSFAAPRAVNRRSWLYRIRPSVGHRPFELIEHARLRGTPFDETKLTPNQLRWDPFPIPEEPVDFVVGLMTIAGCGDSSAHAGAAIHLYVANRSMSDSFFSNADGEMLVVPQQGELLIRTEFGVLELKPGEIGVINRGVKFRVELRGETAARGYVCENYGAFFRLPDLGVIGANGLANPRDFLAPAASYEDVEGKFQIITKFDGQLWATELDHSPLDVVAWHGNYAPYKYDLARFNTLGTVSFDHPDPSLFTVLTSPSEIAGTANVDFVVFPPRWLVAEHTFRPPYFHRNFMSEYMGLIYGQYDAKAEGFLPGGGSLHNSMSAHGPDATTFENASAAQLKPHRLEGTLAFMFETRFACRPTRFAMDAPERQRHYDECWRGMPKHFSAQS